MQNVDYDFNMCLLDDDTYIGVNKTLDPKLLEWLAAQNGTTQPETNSTNTTASNVTQPPVMTDNLLATLKAHLPKYQGMPHPQPSSGNPTCDDQPWSAPFLPEYEGPLHAKNTSGNLTLTMCNYYLPAAPDVRGIDRWERQNYSGREADLLL